jgi:hypothetical protein
MSAAPTLTVAELRKQLSRAGLSTSGLKSELLARLQAQATSAGGGGGSSAASPQAAPSAPTPTTAHPAAAPAPSAGGRALERVWVANTLSGEGELVVLASPQTIVESPYDASDLLFYGDPEAPKGAPFRCHTSVGATVYVASQCDRGCCFEVLGVFSTRTRAEAAKAEVSEHVVLGE